MPGIKTSAMSLNKAVRQQRRANPLFRGAIEQRAALSFGSFLFAAEKKRTPAQDTQHKKHTKNQKQLKQTNDNQTLKLKPT
jgi:hypothetical protein